MHSTKYMYLYKCMYFLNMCLTYEVSWWVPFIRQIDMSLLDPNAILINDSEENKLFEAA